MKNRSKKQLSLVGLAVVCVLIWVIQVTKQKQNAGLRDFVSRDGVAGELLQRGCAVCKTGIPCQYPEEVDIRIIVLAFNREKSLHACLQNLQHLVLNGAKIAVDIWIDVLPDGSFHQPTYFTARSFTSSWQQGAACVHLQTTHAHVAKQWLFSWRPRENSKEMVLIIEDDVDISPHAVQWLLAANKTFYDDSSVYSYSLQMENVCAQHSKSCVRIAAPPEHIAFKMPILGNWGFSPKGPFWRKFQDWYMETTRKDPAYKPYVEAFRSNDWFKSFEKRGKEESMAHEMWLIHYVAGHREKLYCLYSNLLQYCGRDHVFLSSHRQEDGLHFQNEAKRHTDSKLLVKWQKDYGAFTKDCPSYDAFGNFVHNW